MVKHDQVSIWRQAICNQNGDVGHGIRVSGVYPNDLIPTH